MPALTLAKRDVWLPEPVTREIYAVRLGEGFKAYRRSIVVLLYPDVAIVDGWYELWGWVSELKYSANVARQPEAIYRALVDCVATVEVDPIWSELLKQLDLLEASPAATLREAYSLFSPAPIARGNSGIQHPDIDLPLLLAGMSYCHSRPTAAFMRGAYNARRDKLQAAVSAFIYEHGKTPEGELRLWPEYGKRLFVDCSELRRMARYGNWPTDVRRAFFLRDEPADADEKPEVTNEP